MDARGTAGAKGSDIFCSRDVGCCIVCRGNADGWALAGEPAARAIPDEVEVDACPGRPTAGEPPPGRGKRVAGEAI